MFHRNWFGFISTLLVLGACGNDGGGGDADPDAGVEDPGPPATLLRASRSSSIAISTDDALVAMVNPDDDSVAVFDTATNARLSRVITGDEPSSIVIGPDNATAYVANRADASVVAISGIDTQAPEVSPAVPVGSEPTGLALSPTGARLFVAEWAEGRISVIETATMTVIGTIDGPERPRAIAVTNDGDTDDDDELVIVPEFFGDAVEEASDTGRLGRVRMYRVSDLSASDPIVFEPIDSGFEPVAGQGTVMTSPNQLYSVTVRQGKIYVTSVSASPAPPVQFNGNVFPVVYVGDLDARAEDRGAVGTANLARLAFDALDPEATRFALADLVDMEFFGDTDIAYAVSRGSNAVQRVVYDPALGVQVGSPINVQIDIGAAPAGSDAGCVVPTGIAVGHEAPRAFVNCWVSRRLGVVDLTAQALIATVEASAPAQGAEQLAIERGKKFFFTGRARWSREAWSACSSCHPDGLTDNMTWSFAAGPRQTTSLDGSFSHGPGQQKQRIFNWTGIFDELHDFERNTRGVSGGLGAITRGACGDLANEVRVDPLPGNLGQPLKELQDAPDGCTTDWDDIDAWVRTVRPPRALQGLDPASVARGAALFGSSNAGANNGDCVKCHGGAGWTASRRFFVPSSATNAGLAEAPFTPPAAWPPSWNLHTLQIDVQPADAEDGVAIAPPQVACVIRNAGTFGVPGDVAATDALEIKANGARAQGAGGFNIPSLYGMALGAPYFHHGQARTLDELLSDPQWQAHLQAGNPVFVPSEQDRLDLKNFLLSIDPATPEQAIPAGFDGCPTP